MATPATTLSSGSTRFSWRPTSWEAQAPELGMTCMVPMAFAGETTAWLKPDSWNATACASAGSTPMAVAAATIFACICALEGTAAPRSVVRFALAAATTGSE